MSFNQRKTVRLGDVCNFQKGFAFKSNDYQHQGRKIIKVSDLSNYNIDISNCACIDENKAASYKQYQLKQDDVIIVTVGSWPSNPNSVVGKVVKVQKEVEKSLLNQNAVRVRGLSTLNQKYLFYVLKNKKFSDYIIGTAQGAANQASITQNDIKNYLFDCLQLNEQKAIADTLSCIDDKIELNNGINKILEEMAQSIFKNWFVDFEFPNEDGQPYKSSGGNMVDSEFGMIPIGWRAVELGNVTTNIRDKTKSNDFRVLSAVNTGNLMLSEEYFTKQVFSKDLSKYIIVKEKEFAYNPARVNIGSIGMNEYDFDGCVSPAYVVFKAEKDYQWFFKLFIKTDNFKSEVLKRASGSVRQAMNYCDFALIKTVYPPKGLIKKFNQFFEACHFTQKELAKETEVLSKIRNELLPKLMSGEIRVPIEEAG